MNYLFTGIFVFFSSLFSCQPKGDYITLSVDEFETLIKDKHIQRLDVRTLGEYTEGHIPGALNINVLNDSFAAMADSTLQKGEPVALYCRSGKRSKKAAAILSSKGYRVYELGEGFNAWLESGKEVEQ